MKKNLFLMTASAYAFILLIACSKASVNSDRTKFSVSETNTEYEISATYNESKINKVQKVVNESVLPTTIFNSDADAFSKMVKLNDNTQFQVKTSPGELLIKLDKSVNSNAALERVKGLAFKIKETLE